MDDKADYPSDFLQARNNTLTDDEVNHLLEKPGCAARFVYGVLMLPTALKYFLDMPQTADIAKYMMHATVYGFKLYHFGPDSTPVMLPSEDPQHRVEGMLILGLNEEHRNRIYEYESGLMRLVDVRAHVTQLDSFEGYDISSVRIVDAGAFVWNQEKVDEGMNELPSTEQGLYTWPMDGILCSQIYQNMLAAQRASTFDLARTSASNA
ncbi:gamma-glutamylcyclotransferase family protein [Aspergillus neoniger CBS 115656]|uniref:Gamma-glutamylcyclotransferase AIG2-like domain-containing protein n=1 Tax=Aspergillus neoniger (strain CBS 115656) TaxID=1448310 RepID=A0A318YB00_ASPNB|nr:hypothetical protein BO87DRAFT_136341 [Aspergillus neoniger CBS 115656]PYH31229.1 hypothetical protein BO87DRAFT_136341 [Aspergillus neoniger CBS 115656]